MECFLCTELYDANTHKPYSLNPCGHHFCVSCLEKTGTKTCPTCRGTIQSKTLNRAVLELITPETNMQGKLLKHSLIGETESLLSEWKTKKESEMKKFKEKLQSLKFEIEKDKIEKITKLEMNSEKLIIYLNAVESICTKDNVKEIEKFSLNVKYSQEQVKKSDESKLALQLAECLKNEIAKKSTEIQNLDEFVQPFSYLKNFNGEHAIGSLVKCQMDGDFVQIK
jgi:hypothetical protein